MPPIPPQLHFPSPYLRPSSAPSIARSIEMADGARIASFVYGARTDATPVLFLHGNGEEHGIFGPAIDVCVEAGHHVVAIDSRGQGKSTLGSTRLTYELMADDSCNPPKEVITPAEIPAGLDRLRKGGMDARLVAVYED